MVLSTIIHSDTLKALETMDDDSIDVIVTSPPYNIGYKAGAMGTDLTGHLYGEENYDFMDETEYQSWMIKVLEELYRVLKPTGSLFFNHKDRTKITQRNKEGTLVKKTQVFVSPSHIIERSKLKIKQRLIWNRKTSHQQNPHMFTPIHEYIYWLVKDPLKVKKNKITAPTVLDFQKEGRKLHPAPFPVDLPKLLISAVASDNALILDPFVGSGSTLLAAQELGFKSIGIDNIERYVEMCEQRVKDCGGEAIVLKGGEIIW